MGKFSLKYIVVWGILHSIFIRAGATQEQSEVRVIACNGLPENCNKPYNRFSQMVSHNATSYAWSPVQNQDRTLQEQLDAGVRAFKIPLHPDYVDREAYYFELLREYANELDKELELFKDDIKKHKHATFMTLDEKQGEVNKLDQLIRDVGREIARKKEWYNKLPSVSLKGNSKALRMLDYAAALAALEIKREALVLAKKAATHALDAAKQVGAAVIEGHPYYVSLRAQKKLLEQVLATVKTRGPRTIFSCHGLPKGEVYGKHLDRLIEAAPVFLRSAVAAVLKPFEQAPNKVLKALFGTAENRGGLAPYPACLLDMSATPLEQFLREIKLFLDTHPSELITVLLNDFVGDNHAVAALFEKSGILPYAYAQDQTRAWPTLGELIASNKRLIVFTDSSHDTGDEYLWLNSREAYTKKWPAHYHFTSPELFLNPTTPVSVFGDYVPKDTGDPDNKILEVHYVVTPSLGGDKDASALINRRHVMMPFLERITKSAKHALAWVHVDFVTPEMCQTVAELNQDQS